MTVPERKQASFEALMRRHNTRLFRVARAIVRNDAEAEDAVQDAYLQAYRKFDDFRGDARLTTWLTRIVVNAALMRLRRHKHETVVPFGGGAEAEGSSSMQADIEDVRAESPQESAFRTEIRQILERRIDELPLAFRAVFVMREVQDMTVQETADALGIPESTVRTRLFRARALLREALQREIDHASGDVFGFAGDRCDRIVAAVLRAIDGAPR